MEKATEIPYPRGSLSAHTGETPRAQEACGQAREYLSIWEAFSLTINTVLALCQALFSLRIATRLITCGHYSSVRSVCHCHLRFTDENTEVQRGEVMRPNLPRKRRQRDSNPRPASTSRVRLFCGHDTSWLTMIKAEVGIKETITDLLIGTMKLLKSPGFLGFCFKADHFPTSIQ